METTTQVSEELTANLKPNQVVFDPENNSSLMLINNPAADNGFMLIATGDIGFMVLRLVNYTETLWSKEDMMRSSLSCRNNDASIGVEVDIDFHFKPNSPKKIAITSHGGPLTIHPSFFEFVSHYMAS